MTGRTLREIVHEAMDNAVENGYFDNMMHGDVSAVATDMCDCCADLNDATPDEIIAEIRSWRFLKTKNT